MAPKRSSLFGSVAAKPSAEPETASDVQEQRVPETAPARAASPPEAPSAPPSRYLKAKTREGKRAATVYLEHEALRQLQKICFDEETTIQALLLEGVNGVFERRGLSRIA